jgi:hypothetical protein
LRTHLPRLTRETQETDTAVTSTLPRTFSPAKILIFGMGDLGIQIARLIMENQYASVCMLAGQSRASQQWAGLLHVSTSGDVRAARVDGLDVESVKTLLANFEPDVIVQCATLLSPFAMKGVGTPAAQAILKGGFALQTAAQLPIIRSVMQARQALGLTCPVINCSYPDVTNAMLASEGLAPDVGIGNVAIMDLRFQRLIPGADDGGLQVIGHHSQLGHSLAGEPAAAPTPVPLSYLHGRKLEDRELLLKPGLERGPTLNYLAAVTVLPILRGVLSTDSVMQAHAPGILGLQGGYPIQFTGGKIALNLPAAVTTEEAIRFNSLSAAGDGIERIDVDGTLSYTQAAKDAVAPWCPELAEPLTLRELDERLAMLRAVIEARA